MFFPFSRLALAAALFLCVPLASALDEMSATAEGRGAITIQGQSLPVSRAEVSLIPGGRFILSLTGEDRYAFRGQWQEQGSRILLTITEAHGAAAQGSGELRLRNNRFRTIQINSADRTFSANFNASGAYKDFTAGATTSDVIKAPVAPSVTAPVPGKEGVVVAAPVAPKPAVTAPSVPAATVSAPKVTVQGAGTFALGRKETKTVDAMEVFLEPDGSVQLKAFGPQGETVLKGTWKDGGRSGGQQRFNLSISAGSSDDIRTAGRGYVLVGAGGHIDAVSVQGGTRAFRSNYTLSFRQR